MSKSKHLDVSKDKSKLTISELALIEIAEQTKRIADFVKALR